MKRMIDFRTTAIGLQPGQPRRQLEEHGAELPLRESQQEHPGQHEEQPRLPPRPQLTPAYPERCRIEPAVLPFDPPVRSTKNKTQPPGAGRWEDGGPHRTLRAVLLSGILLGFAGKIGRECPKCLDRWRIFYGETFFTVFSRQRGTRQPGHQRDVAALVGCAILLEFASVTF